MLEVPTEIVYEADLNKVYWIAGALLLANLGTLITLITIGARAIWYFAKLDSRVEKNSRDIDNAFRRFRNDKDSSRDV